MTSESTAALPTILHDWANLRTYLQPTTTVKRYAAIPGHLGNVRIALEVLGHSLPCYVISKPQVLREKKNPLHVQSLFGFTSFNRPVFLDVQHLFHLCLQDKSFFWTTFVSFESTKFIVFLDVRHLILED